jgi:chromosome segregation ATPase
MQQQDARSRSQALASQSRSTATEAAQAYEQARAVEESEAAEERQRKAIVSAAASESLKASAEADAVCAKAALQEQQLQKAFHDAQLGADEERAKMNQLRMKVKQKRREAEQAHKDAEDLDRRLQMQAAQNLESLRQKEREALDARSQYGNAWDSQQEAEQNVQAPLLSVPCAQEGLSSMLATGTPMEAASIGTNDGSARMCGIVADAAAHAAANSISRFAEKLTKKLLVDPDVATPGAAAAGLATAAAGMAPAGSSANAVQSPLL